MLALLTLALAQDPLFDIAAQGLVGAGGATDGTDVQGVLGRAGGSVTGWITPDVGLGLRIDMGSYGVLNYDDFNIFTFIEAGYRINDDLQVGLGVGTPVIWVEYNCIKAPCPQGPWEYHRPIGTASASWDLSTGNLLFAPGARLEVGGNRWGLGADLTMGLRLNRNG